LLQERSGGGDCIWHRLRRRVGGVTTSIEVGGGREPVVRLTVVWIGRMRVMNN